MAPKVLIACARGEEEWAEKLAAPLREAGYDVAHRGTVLVGESEVGEAIRHLEGGAAVVLCGTERAAGNKWVKRLAHAARSVNRGMLFVVQMEEEADVEPLSLGETIACYWQDPSKAVDELLASLRKYYPAASGEAAAPTGPLAERRYRELLLETCDIINLGSLPEQDRHIAQKQRDLKLRCLYIPLRARVEPPVGSLAARVELLRGCVRNASDAVKARRGAVKERCEARQARGAEGARKTQCASVGERLAKAKRLVILGDPGAGKTTLTRWIATAYLLRLKQDEDWKHLPDVETLPDADLLPIIIRCRELDLNCLNGALDDVLQHTLRRAELSDAEGAALRQLLRERLRDGTAILMLDGLDEITDPGVRARFCQQLEQIVVAYPTAHIVATSRIVGYREMGYKLGRGFEHLTLADLEPEEKNEFARRWCLLTELPERRAAAEQELIHDLHSSNRIERLTGNPMLLTTMALVKRKVGKLPSRRADLYWEAVQVLLNWRSEVDEPMEWREAWPHLEYVAYDLSNRGVQRVTKDEILDLFARMRRDYPNLHATQRRPEEEFLKCLEARTGILVEAGYVKYLGRLEPVYEFRHLTFQEYLAARALVDACFPGHVPERSLAECVAPLAGRTAETSYSDGGNNEAGVVEGWREALRLCTAICNDKDVDPVLAAILTPLSGDGPTIKRARTIMAALCLADEPNASTEVAELVVRVLVEEVREGDGSGRSRTGLDVAAMELAGTRWAALLRSHLVTRYLRDPDDPHGGLVAMVEAAGSPPAEPELTNWLVRLAIRLGQSEDSEAVRAALAVVQVAYQDKAQLVPGLVEGLLGNLSRSPPVASASAWALAWLSGGLFSRWDPAPVHLDRILAVVSGASSDPRTVRFLAGVLQTHPVGIAAEPLLRWLNSSVPRVRAEVAYALGAIKSEMAVAPLVAHLDDSDGEVKREVRKALGRIGSEAAVGPLIDRLDDSDEDARRRMLEALSTGLEVADQKLLSRDLDGVIPFLDPREPISNLAVDRAASKLNLAPDEVRRRYEALADRFHLRLEWRENVKGA